MKNYTYEEVKNIVNEIEEMGYIVKFERGTEIFEPFKSIVTNKTTLISLGDSSSKYNKKMLEEYLTYLKNI